MHQPDKAEKPAVAAASFSEKDVVTAPLGDLSVTEKPAAAKSAYIRTLTERLCQWAADNPEVAYKAAGCRGKLLPAGDQYLVACPLPYRKRARHMIVIDGGRWRCPTCGDTGDIITLTTDVHGISWVLATKLLEGVLSSGQ